MKTSTEMEIKFYQIKNMNDSLLNWENILI